MESLDKKRSSKKLGLSDFSAGQVLPKRFRRRTPQQSCKNVESFRKSGKICGSECNPTRITPNYPDRSVIDYQTIAQATSLTQLQRILGQDNVHQCDGTKLNEIPDFKAMLDDEFGISSLWFEGNEKPPPYLSRRHRKELERKKCQDVFSTLPSELVLKIFTWLDQKAVCSVAKVSKRFNQLANDHSLHVRENLSHKTLKVCALRTLMAMRKVKSVCLQNAKIVPSSNALQPEVPAIESLCLRELDLGFASVDMDTLASIFKHCDRLVQINLQYLQVNDEIFKEISKNKELEILNLSQTRGLEKFYSSFIQVLQNCQKLVSISLAWTNLSELSPEQTLSIVDALPKDLLELDLSGSRGGICETGFKRICKSAPGLQCLDVSDDGICQESIYNVTVDVLQDLLKNLPSLRKLAINRCYSLATEMSVNSTKDVVEFMTDLLNPAKKLRELSIFGLFQLNTVLALQTKLAEFGVEVNINAFGYIACCQCQNHSPRANVKNCWLLP